MIVLLVAMCLADDLPYVECNKAFPTTMSAVQYTFATNKTHPAYQPIGEWTEERLDWAYFYCAAIETMIFYGPVFFLFYANKISNIQTATNNKGAKAC